MCKLRMSGHPNDLQAQTPGLKPPAPEGARSRYCGIRCSDSFKPEVDMVLAVPIHAPIQTPEL
jgi:hypothetical protein